MHIWVRKSCLGLAKHPVLGTPHGIPFGMMVCESQRVLLTAGVRSRGPAPFKLTDAAVCCLSLALLMGKERNGGGVAETATEGG